jgi:hypothetical protein
VGTWGGYPPAKNMNSDLPGSVGTGDPDLRVKFPMSIPTSILATTHGLALLVSSLNPDSCSALFPCSYLKDNDSQEQEQHENQILSDLRTKTKMSFCKCKGSLLFLWIIMKNFQPLLKSHIYRNWVQKHGIYPREGRRYIPWFLHNLVS